MVTLPLVLYVSSDYIENTFSFYLVLNWLPGTYFQNEFTPIKPFELAHTIL